MSAAAAAAAAPAAPVAPPAPEKEYTVEEVARHNNKASAWFIIDSIVYDLTKFAKLHPGGEQELLNYAGQDATSIFYEMHRQDVLTKFGPRFRIGKIVGMQEQFPQKKPGEISKVPYAEPNWMQGWKSPYFSESHHKFGVNVRKLHDDFAAEAQEMEEREMPVPLAMVARAASSGAFWMLLGPGKHLHGKKFFGLKGEDYDFFHELILSEQLLRHGLRSFSDGFVGGMVIGLPPIFNHGTDQMKAGPMLEVLEGRKRICLAVSEPYVGSDVADLKCSAKLTPDGKHYIVNGAKKWITGGMYADYFTTAVRTGDDGPLGVSLLLIERGPGVSTKPIKTSYSPTAGTAYVIFDNAKVPRENVIGEENMGFMAIMSNFNHERWTMIVTNVRHCRLIVEECFKWANQRVVFGKPLLKQPVIRFKFAKMIAELETVQAWLYEITNQMNHFGYKGTRLAGAIALCKMKSTRVSQYIADEAVQIFGGRGITKSGMGKHIEHFQRTIKFSAILGGAEEILADLGVRMAVKRMPNSRL